MVLLKKSHKKTKTNVELILMTVCVKADNIYFKFKVENKIFDQYDWIMVHSY